MKNILDNLISNHYEDKDIICMVDADDILINPYSKN